MIRPAVEADRWPLIRLMQRCRMGCADYTYGQMDGTIVLDVHDDGAIRGYVSFWLGRPETHIRQLVVAPEFRDGTVLWGLLRELTKLALAYGSQGIEGFQTDEHPEVQALFHKVGARPENGRRARWPLSPKVSAEADHWREALLA